MANPSQSLIQAPNFTGYIDQTYFLEPLGGSTHPYTYLDRFPENIYSLSPLGHLVKFLYTFLGPAGTGGARQNYLQVRLILQEHGYNAFSLDNFYGNPFAFGRLLTEQLPTDPTGLLTQQQWDQIQAANSSYQNRAIDFMNAARAGNSPMGIYFAARSGLGHNVEIIENYRYLYDQHSDDPIGIPYMGTSLSTEEVIILPRQDISQSEIQTVGISNPPAGGFFTLSFDGQETQPIAPTATRLDIQNFLESLPNIGEGNVIVTGGPGPSVPWQISFTGKLGGQALPQIEFHSSLLTMQTTPLGEVNTTVGGIEASDDPVYIAPQDQYYMTEALSQIKPVTMISTFNQASGVTSRTLWNSIFASSEFTEVIRFVTGSPDIETTSWIQANVENQAPKLATGRLHHYEGFHAILHADAYTDGALSDATYETASFNKAPYNSEHFGSFTPLEQTLIPYLNNSAFALRKFSAQDAIEQNPELLVFDDISPDGSIVVVNEWYPIEIYNLLYKLPAPSDNVFWASVERITGSEYLELDLGLAQAVNYISFETTHKPFSIDISFDLLDDTTGRRRFFPVTPSANEPFEDNITFSSDSKNPWQFVEFNFTNSKGGMIFTRYIRIGFTRITNTNSPFTGSTGALNPFTIDVRKLRIGRSVFIDDDREIGSPQPFRLLGPPLEQIGPII